MVRTEGHTVGRGTFPLVNPTVFNASVLGGWGSSAVKKPELSKQAAEEEVLQQLVCLHLAILH